jgi:hypothetical protein
MPFVSGFLRIRRGGHPDQGLPGGEGPVDPGYGIGIEHPDQGLPGPQPGIDNELPTPPPGIWPPLTPSHPIQPAPPGTPPGAIWPPVGHPSHPIAPGGSPPAPDQGLPAGSLRPDQGLPSNKFWVVCGIPGVGWRYICVDPSLKPTPPMAPGGSPGAPDQGLPPTAQPRRA